MSRAKRYFDSSIDFIKLSGHREPEEETEGKGLTPDQKRIHWEAYAKKTERQEEVFKRVFDSVFEEQKNSVAEHLRQTGQLPQILNDEQKNQVIEQLKQS